MSEKTWIFDRGPGSGKGRGADTIEMLFEGDGSLVKEGVQNASDQLRKNSKDAIPIGMINIDLAEFKGDQKEKIKDLINWQKLRKHCEAATIKNANSPEASALEAAIARLDDPNIPLRILSISDFGTEGLSDDFEGLETEEDRDTNYTRLCRDEHNTNNDDTTRSGSHGLGKIVNWKFSGINSVIFNSLTWKTRDNKNNLIMRTCGQCLLWSHRLDGKAYDNTGYFGQHKLIADNIETAVSTWGDDSIAAALGLVRPVQPEFSGTSVSIIDYFDESITDEKGAAVIQRLCEDVEKFFWPALQGETALPGKPNLKITLTHSVNGETVYEQKAAQSDYISFKRALDDAPNTDVISEVDQVAAKDSIPITVRREDGANETVEAQMNVRLCSTPLKTLPHDLAGHVAKLRDRVMVIEYEKIKTAPKTEFDLCGVIALGFARGNDEEDKVTHDFLRLYEPPAHDNWNFFNKVRKKFRDFRKLILEINTSYKAAIKELSNKKIDTDGKPIPLLAQLLNFGITGDSMLTRTTNTRPVSMISEAGTLKARFFLDYTNKDATPRDRWKALLTFNIKGANLGMKPMNLELLSAEGTASSNYSCSFGPNDNVHENQILVEVNKMEELELVATLMPPNQFNCEEIISSMTVDVKSTLLEEDD